MGTNRYGYASCMETCGMEKPCKNTYCSANPKHYQQKATPMSTRPSSAFTQAEEGETGSTRERIFK